MGDRKWCCHEGAGVMEASKLHCRLQVEWWELGLYWTGNEKKNKVDHLEESADGLIGNLPDNVETK